MNGTKINLVKDTISNTDIDNLISWLSTYPRLTQGPLVKEFEQNWSEYIKTEFSTFVNSGSSALLLSYYHFKLLGVQSVIVPALSWATDVSPLIQLGIRPILCDCNLEDLSLDLEHLTRILDDLNDTSQTLVNIVSVLGLVPDMQRLMDLKKKYRFYLLEDVCESFGSEFQNKKLGSFGDVSVFSLYYGHHLSTIEGGMICTSAEHNDQIKMLRAHGWDRELNPEKQAQLRDEHKIDDFSAAYTFYLPGFNLRATDLQAKIGIDQLKKANQINQKRNENFNHFYDSLRLGWKPVIRPSTFVSNFCYPIISLQKKEIIAKLIENGIECRPLICGSMGNQPFYKKAFPQNILPNASFVDEYGLYIPNNPDLTQKELSFIIETINSAL
jgi:CDP-6-deoxy-D-xylo-4-hexulose-3-dehydrase